MAGSCLSWPGKGQHRFPCSLKNVGQLSSLLSCSLRKYCACPSLPRSFLVISSSVCVQRIKLSKLALSLASHLKNVKNVGWNELTLLPSRAQTHALHDGPPTSVDLISHGTIPVTKTSLTTKKISVGDGVRCVKMQ